MKSYRDEKLKYISIYSLALYSIMKQKEKRKEKKKGGAAKKE